MPTTIDIGQVKKLIREGAQIVEVLPWEEFENEHIAGAIHLPLKSLNRESAAILDKQRPIIVYCHD